MSSSDFQFYVLMIKQSPQWPSGLVDLASNYRLSPLCGSDHGNAEGPSHYEPGVLRSHDKKISKKEGLTDILKTEQDKTICSKCLTSRDLLSLPYMSPVKNQFLAYLCIAVSRDPKVNK